MASTAGAAVGRLEVAGTAGRPVDGRHELRPDFASGLPGPSYGQKTNLNPTTGDPWVRPLGLGGLLASGDPLQCVQVTRQRSWVPWITSWLGNRFWLTGYLG